MKLKGRIIDEHGNPVSHATVDIRVGETLLARVASGSDGGFQFSSSGPPVGDNITLAVTKEGYQSAHVTKAARAGDLEDWLLTIQQLHPGIPWRVLLAVVIIGSVIFALILMPSKVTVPRLIGETLDDASNTVHRLNLVLESPVEIITKTNVPGTIVNQEPQPDEKVVRGTSVQLAFEGEPALVEVPDLSSSRDLTVDAAINRLLAAKLLPAPIRREPTASTQLWGKIIDQKPGPHEKVDTGTEVELTVATKQRSFVIPISPELSRKLNVMQVDTNRVLRFHQR